MNGVHVIFHVDMVHFSIEAFRADMCSNTNWMSSATLYAVMCLKFLLNIGCEQHLQVMIETLRPEETLREVSVRADLPQILFRKLRQEYINMGYGYRHKSYDHAE